MGAAQLNYNGTLFNFKRGPVNFLARDAGRVHDNVSTSGLRERVFEAADLIISFTMPAIAIGDDFNAWRNFYAWALSGGWFAFAPNSSVTYAPAPWSGGVYYFTCTLEDTDFAPQKAGFRIYSLDVKLRVVNDNLRPANAGIVMDAFWGQAPA